MKKKIATTKNGYKVFVDTKESHAATHIKDHPELLKAVALILSADYLEGDEISMEYDTGDIIGTTDLVKTTENDKIIYAKRINRDNYTRFVKNRQPVPTSLITMVLRKQDYTMYELWSVWIGPKVPSFPSDERVTPESKEFWSNHALVWGRQAIQEGTETTDCPW